MTLGCVYRCLNDTKQTLLRTSCVVLGNAYLSGAPDFTSGFHRGSCCPVICVSLFHVIVLSFVFWVFIVPFVWLLGIYICYFLDNRLGFWGHFWCPIFRNFPIASFNQWDFINNLTNYLWSILSEVNIFFRTW